MADVPPASLDKRSSLLPTGEFTAEGSVNNPCADGHSEALIRTACLSNGTMRSSLCGMVLNALAVSR